MTPLREWLRPPRTLLLILYLLTLVSVSALGWFGWKLLDQERMIDTQRSQERLEQAADRMVATLRGTLAETGERLGGWTATPPVDLASSDGLLLLINGNTFGGTPRGRLLYEPNPPLLPEARSEIFEEGERLEFQQQEPAKALAFYGRLADSTDPATRAGALLRQARVLRNTGRAAESRAVYAKLSVIPNAAVAGAPADLVARHALDAASVREDLLQPRWRLTRGQFEFYWSGQPVPPPADRIAFSEAAWAIWENRKRDAAPRGYKNLWVNGRAFLVLWRGSPERRAVLIAEPEKILKSVSAGDEIVVAALDSEGRRLGGRRIAGGHAVLRTMADTQLPWTLYVNGSPDPPGSLAARQRFLMMVTGVMAFFLILGTYFIARAIRREAQVLRMQSDFVSAVSHEFRSPLTSMRQLSEILAFGRVPSDERRQKYYETLVRETQRLQRLVEALLNFGRMEAGARLYRFEPLDAGALIHRVAAEFESQVGGAGRHISLSGAGSECTIDGDPEAISVALRNLVDNALKYSPDHPTVWVEWGVENEFVAIRVRDKGLGIAESERKAIFRKFVRGSAAHAANVKGSGVGLAMVRHIVAAHGGAITVASEPGQGCTFTMFLPAGGKA